MKNKHNSDLRGGDLYHVVDSRQRVVRLLVERGHLQCQLKIPMVAFQVRLELQPPAQRTAEEVGPRFVARRKLLQQHTGSRNDAHILLMCFLLLEMLLPSVFPCFSSFRAKWLISSWRFLWSCSSCSETWEHSPSVRSSVFAMCPGRQITAG